MFSLNNEIFKKPKDNIRTMWFTAENPDGTPGAAAKTLFGRKGSPNVFLKTGETLTLLNTAESGTVRRIWIVFSLSQKALRGMKLEMYWDGAETPAVRAPIGDFFCHGGGRRAPFENACFASPEGRSCVCMIPMPFKKGAKILLKNECPHDDWIYYEVDCTLGDDHGDDVMYFHSYFTRENMTELRRDFTILPYIKGCGRFLGTMITTRIDPLFRDGWWGEGEVKVYLDGDGEYPSLCGTGTEDYISTGYGQGRFDNLYSGDIIAEEEKIYTYYRFHIPDPVYFHEEIRVTIQVMGGPTYPQMLAAMDKNPDLRIMKPGDGTEYFTREELEANLHLASVVERQDDVSAMSYWYMTSPEDTLGDIIGAEERLCDLI